MFNGGVSPPMSMFVILPMPSSTVAAVMSGRVLATRSNTQAPSQFWAARSVWASFLLKAFMSLTNICPPLVLVVMGTVEPTTSSPFEALPRLLSRDGVRNALAVPSFAVTPCCLACLISVPCASPRRNATTPLTPFPVAAAIAGLRSVASAATGTVPPSCTPAALIPELTKIFAVAAPGMSG